MTMVIYSFKNPSKKQCSAEWRRRVYIDSLVFFFVVNDLGESTPAMRASQWLETGIRKGEGGWSNVPGCQGQAALELVDWSAEVLVCDGWQLRDCGL